VFTGKHHYHTYGIGFGIEGEQDAESTKWALMTSGDAKPP